MDPLSSSLCPQSLSLISKKRENQTGDRATLSTLPNELLVHIFQFLPDLANQYTISLTSRRFKNLVEKDLDIAFINKQIYEEIELVPNQTILLKGMLNLFKRFHKLTESLDSTRASRFVDRICFFLDQSLSYTTLLALFQPLILQRDIYLATKEGINPEPFLIAIYNSISCPKALQLQLSQNGLSASLPLYPKEEEITSPLYSNIAPSINEIHFTSPLLHDECKKLSIHPENKFQKKEIVAICYQKSIISTPQILFGCIRKIKKNGLYDVQFHCTKENIKRIYTLAPEQIGRLAFCTNLLAQRSSEAISFW